MQVGRWLILMGGGDPESEENRHGLMVMLSVLNST